MSSVGHTMEGSVEEASMKEIKKAQCVCESILKP